MSIKLEAIVAVYTDWGIGSNGTQPIVVPEDRRRFRETTGTDAVVVGRKTLADFPNGRPLKNRKNFVLSRQNITVEGAVMVNGVDAALDALKNEARAFIIGGASVYEAFLPFISRIYVTKIDAAPPSDAFFPNLDESPEWRCVEDGGEQISGDISFNFCVYDRIESQ